MGHTKIISYQEVKSVMKQAEKNKPIDTIPDGAWEAGIINEDRDRKKQKNPNEITTDSQGNGYPVCRHRQES